MKETRSDWEALVLSCCLLEKEGFPLVGSVLTEKNFREEAHKSIWQTMTQLYPNSPINIVTVSARLVDPAKAEMLRLYTNYYCSPNNLLYYAYQILNQDLLLSWHTHLYSLQVAEPWLRSEVEVMIKVATDWCDVFEMIDEVTRFFKSDHQFRVAYEATRAFADNIDKRILHIKRQSHINSLFHHLSAFDNMPSGNRLLLRKMGELTRHLLNGGNIDQHLENQILAFKND